MKTLSEQEIKDMAVQTYELGVKMHNTFTDKSDHRDYMVLAIMGCISGLVNKPYGLMPVADYSGDYFKMLRLKKGFTLRQVEDATGISNSYLSQLETGKVNKPSHRVIKTLHDFYIDGISVEKDKNQIGITLTT